MAVDPDDRQFGGNDGYTDQADIFYSWDSRVPNAKAVQPGDRVAVWDKRKLLGASVVEGVATGHGVKTLYRCQACRSPSIKRRKSKSPLFRCQKQTCRAEFNAPITETVAVSTYCSTHDAAWTPLEGVLDAAEVRRLARDPGSQHAIRPLSWTALEAALLSKDFVGALSRINARSTAGSSPVGGHRIATTRVRRGQGKFREQLLRSFGETCALTGACPADVLEAGHLYSYAELGKHHEHGGLLLRRDVHRLFDRGALAIHPQHLTVDVSSSLQAFPVYASLHGRPLQVELRRDYERWFAKHWEQHRSD